MSEVITLANQKGGCGKTTTVVNMATCLAQKGIEVLAVDMDPQSATTTALGIEKRNLKKTIYDVLINEADIQEVTLKAEIENLRIVPSNIYLSGAEIELAGEVGREYILKNCISEIRDDYDYIIIDTPPSLGVLTINSLVSCDSIIIPIQTEYYALEGLSFLLEAIDLVRNRLNNSVKIKGVLLTMFDVRTSLSKEVAKEVKDFFKEKVLNTVIPRNVRVAEAPSYGKPVILYDPECKGSLAYKKLAEEVINRE